jgi:hypothetical protein
MAAQIFRIKPGLAFSPILGPQLLNVIENLNASFSTLLNLRAALIQEKDSALGTDPDYVTPAAIFGFVDGTGALSSAVAHLAFTEIDTFVTTAQASLQQMCARFKQ